ncbi:ABC transporter permease [Fusibacter bizertensis]|jgi:ABC-type dipeptide/oligopeptide/nickel transport systems, permease components|uniref:ABC transporter permease n=1 Tax=Fusibacter bizertensis TaxID=1488331 RepID=A0ABT6N802_9FIRM|nr:ABC transporter permease [Fusibacter bizertensis]MDH8676540.1 ABC transporter permease [Fusibacter bizertensis]
MIKEQNTPWKLAKKRLLRNKIALFGAFLLISILCFTYLGPLFSPYIDDQIDVVMRFKAPSFAHPFGTDRLGHDMMTQIMRGGQVSLAIASLSAIVTLFFGTLVGVFSGYYGKWVDQLLMRFTEFVYVLPLLPMIIAFTAIFAFGVPPIIRMIGTMIIFGFLSFPPLARLIRAEIISLKKLEFIKASELLGISKFSQIFKHLLPNVVGVIVASSTSIIANAILLELTLSFVGMGFPPPTPTWGNLIPNIRGDSMVSSGYYWMWFYPVSFISLTIISINLLGEGLRDALDPKSEGR